MAPTRAPTSVENPLANASGVNGLIAAAKSGDAETSVIALTGLMGFDTYVPAGTADVAALFVAEEVGDVFVIMH